MNWYRQIHKLQIDITSHCNARCGACIRNVDGGETRPGLPLTHFDVDVWKRMATCLLYTSPSPRDQRGSRMPSSA